MPEARHRERRTPRSFRESGTAFRPPSAGRTAILAAILALVAAGCGDEPHPRESSAPTGVETDAAVTEDVPDHEDLVHDRSLGISRDAKLDTLAMLVEDLALERHPADGGGRGWVEAVEDETGQPISAHAGGRARVRMVYQAGPHGIVPGGTLFFQVSPFWGWDPPQPEEREAPGYTEVTRKPKGIETQAIWLGSELLAIEISGRKLEAGEEIALSYGAGPRLARVDRYAEHGARLWFAVDGDGDGVRDIVDESPTIDIAPGEAAGLLAIVPTTARPGEDVVVRISVLDRQGNAGIPYRGSLLLEAEDGLVLPERVEFESESRGSVQLTARVEDEGIYRVRAQTIPSEGHRYLATESNPLVVESEARHVRWADLHGHSQLSDGTGTPTDFFRYARDVSGLDVVALTDHDHWGMRFLDSHPALWQEIRDNVREFHAPGSFVTLLGYEWTSWVHGHRHVLYFRNQGEVASTLDPRFESPAQLWAELAGKHALTFAHHSAGGPISTNWNYRPDPTIEPVTEIASVHGSSESLDSPASIYNPVPGNFVRDALDHGFRFGFIGSGDSHDGHPGAAHISSRAGGGLAAILSEDLTREGIREALLARRVYATNGARVFLEVRIDDHPMGSTIKAADAAPGAGSTIPPITQELSMHVVAEAPLERIDIIRSGRTATIAIDGAVEAPSEWQDTRTIPALNRGEYHYIRVVQRNGGVAWSSPIFAE